MRMKRLFLHKIIDDIDQRFSRETDRVEGIPGADDDAWALVVGAVDDVMIFYGTGVQPKTAKGIHRGMADDEPGLRGQFETLPEPLDIALGVPGQVIGALHSCGDKLDGEEWIACYINKIISVDRLPWRSSMAGKKAVRADDVRQCIIKSLHLFDIRLAAMLKEGLSPQEALEHPVFIDLRIEAVVVAAKIVKIAGVDQF